MSTCVLFSEVKTDILLALQDYRLTHQQSLLYLLIDPRANRSAIPFWQDPALTEHLWIIRDPQDRLSDDSQCLHLLAIPATETALLKASVGQSQDPLNRYSMCGWLFSRKKGDVIQQHLIKMLILHYQSVAYQFRYFDPRVMRRLIRILTHAQLDCLLGMIESWLFINEYNRLTIMTHRARPVVDEQPIRLTFNQWRRLTKINLFNQVVDQYRALFLQPLSAQQERLLEDVLIQSERFCITEGADIVTLGLFGLIYGQSILRHPWVQQKIKQSVKQRVALLTLFTEQTDQFWQSFNQ